MSKFFIAGGSFKSIQDIREYSIENADRLEKPDYESPEYFYNRWAYAASNSEQNQTWDTQEVPKMEIGELIIHRARNRHNEPSFYRYGMVAKICDGTVVSGREIFIAYDLGPAIGMSTNGRAIPFPVNPYSAIQLCQNVRDNDWLHANNNTFSLALRKLDLEIELTQSKNKISELESLLRR